MAPIQLQIHKIESYTDLNGSLGKRIELVETIDKNAQLSLASSPEQKEIQALMLQVQAMLPMQLVQKQPTAPKLILYLTETECDSLNIKLDVNQTYDVTFENGNIRLSLPEQPKQDAPLASS